MTPDLRNPQIREQILTEVNGSENMDRKEGSLAQSEIYKDRIKYYVRKYLEGFYSTSTIDELPLVSSVNIARRIVNKEGSLYSNKPKRTFTGVSEQQAQMLEMIYREIGVDSAMLKANRFYKLQDDQTTLYVIPSQGKLKVRPFMQHNLDVIPKIDDPEVGDVFLVTGFDRSLEAIKLDPNGDYNNQLIADSDDYRATLEAIEVWSEAFNFTMDKSGNIMSETIDNPIGGVVPFVDIFASKDGEYWVRQGQSLTEFTVQFNAALTDLAHIVRMQGFGQPYFIGDDTMIPESLKIGPNFVLRLPINPNNPGIQPEFGFANANPDIAGSIQQIEMLLSSFLTSRGLDPSLVNGKGGGQKYNSGFERMLSMLDSFEPAKADYDVFQVAEKKLFQVIRAYLNTYGGTPILPNYRLGFIPEDSDVEVNFAGPETVISETEKLDLIQRKIEMGLITRVEAVAMDRNITKEQAEAIMEELTSEEMPEQEEPETEETEEQETEETEEPEETEPEQEE